MLLKEFMRSLMSSKAYYNYKEIEAFVFENEEALQKATLQELYQFAEENGFTRSGFEFSRFKEALEEIGVNYDDLKERKL